MKLNQTINMYAEDLTEFLEKALGRYIAKKVDSKVISVEVSLGDISEAKITLEPKDLDAEGEES